MVLRASILLLYWTAWITFTTADVGICSRCSIYILDISSLARLHGFPSCDLNRMRVDPQNGVVYLKDHGPKDKVDHAAGTHSAPWYLYKAIQNSDCETEDIESADLIFVYDYCYYTWWLAHVHSLGRENRDTPGDYLIQGWTAMTHLPRWKRNGGRDFVFYDAHPGFVSGHSAQTFVGMLCNEFRHSTHIIVERAQRNTCQSYLEISKQLITPYVPNVVDTEDPLNTFMRPSVPRSKRNITVFFSGKCIPFRGNNVGKKMRYAIVQALKDAGEDTDIQCTENENGHIHQDFHVMLNKMEHSVFCLVVPGDAQSTRRLSEIFMAGCIPVFLGPPYNSMPLPDDVNYRSVGVFFNITAYKSWLPNQMKWSIGSERAKFAQEARWWIPDAEVGDIMITVDTVGDIMAHLRGMPDMEINRKLKEMQFERLRMTFQGEVDSQQNAVQAILNNLCEINVKQSGISASATSAMSIPLHKGGTAIAKELNYTGPDDSSNKSLNGLKKGKSSGNVMLNSFLKPVEAQEDAGSDAKAKAVTGKTNSALAHDKSQSINLPKKVTAQKGATSLGHSFLTAQTQSQTGLHTSIAGAIRVKGNSWEPFNVEQAHKPAISSRQK